MDSTAQTSPRDSDIINKTSATGDAWIRQPKEALRTQISSTKLHPRVTLGFDSPNSPYGTDIINKIASTGDKWIRQPKQPIGIQK
jgi:hypothetical protein